MRSKTSLRLVRICSGVCVLGRVKGKTAGEVVSVVGKDMRVGELVSPGVAVFRDPVEGVIEWEVRAL